MPKQISPAAQGEFRGDFTRDTFNPLRHFSRVLMQQGRVQLDANWNEQTSILLHLVRSLAADLIGPYAGSVGSFEIAPTAESIGSSARATFSIGAGHYYVDGILVEQEGETAYYTQPHFSPSDQLPNSPYLVYLDVWERHVTQWQYPEIREVALRGPDTATRAEVVWQVRWLGIDASLDPNTLKQDGAWGEFSAAHLTSGAPGCLQAIAKTEDLTTLDPCLVPPDAQYTGPENQLYRVEVHTVTPARPEQPAQVAIKWSRDNSSLAFVGVQKPVLNPQNRKEVTFVVESLGRDDRTMLEVDDWVEIVDMGEKMPGVTGQMARVTAVDFDTPSATLHASGDLTIEADRTYLLRRWDHRGDQEAITIRFDSDRRSAPIPLEHGIFVTLELGDGSDDFVARPGDYWLIPARTETGDIEWPRTNGSESLFIEPHGPTHHFAPLAVIKPDGSVTDLRRELDPRSLWTQM